jgi:HAD superfamily hydrolase (TIGR01509 family)
MIKGIIFDMDGVISDTQNLHSKVESELLARFGVIISPEEITKLYSGVRTKEFFNDLLSDTRVSFDLDSLMDEKWLRMSEYASKSVVPIDGSVDLIKRLYSQGYSLAVASASNFKYVKTVLKTLDVFDYFSFIVSGDMVKSGKPDPESFLLAASKMNISPKNCLVIEDGISGMHAAKSAGMFCVGLVDGAGDYPTNNLVSSLSQINLEYLNNLS